MMNFRLSLLALAQANVEFVVIGGVAAFAHGSPRLTLDVDVAYRRTPENLERVVAALRPHDPYLRGAPPGLPFKWDAATLKRGLNFTLTTALGHIDLLGEVAGGGRYEDLLPYCSKLQIYGVECRCLNLPRLIQVKRAAGRPKDFEAIAELEAILEEQERTETEPSP
jgi:predicted nucleotidyltransferase